jgi:hypothetical protein
MPTWREILAQPLGIEIEGTRHPLLPILLRLSERGGGPDRDDIVETELEYFVLNRRPEMLREATLTSAPNEPISVAERRS